ncbi:unnamed protein product [Colias eurytheme]|nr:unnamed protein product [Colias eurytheme]
MKARSQPNVDKAADERDAGDANLGRGVNWGHVPALTRSQVIGLRAQERMKTNTFINEPTCFGRGFEINTPEQDLG